MYVEHIHNQLLKIVKYALWSWNYQLQTLKVNSDHPALKRLIILWSNKEKKIILFIK